MTDARSENRSTAARVGWSERRRIHAAGRPDGLRAELERGAIGWLLLAVYVVYAGWQLGFSAERFSTGLEHGHALPGADVSAEFRPMGADPSGIVESLQIAVIATFFGILLSLPIGLLAARNLMPAWISWPTRGFIALCRSLSSDHRRDPVRQGDRLRRAGRRHGPDRGSIGFISKLFAEAIEEISIKQVEAVRATGAVVSERADHGRAAAGAAALHRVLRPISSTPTCATPTMVGIVGGGGIGAALFTAYQRFDFDVVLAILIVIVSLIMVAEIVSGWVRRVFQ